jgi:hypothetical protein
VQNARRAGATTFTQDRALAEDDMKEHHASSAGILMYRWTGPRPEVLLVHPGGPFWRNKDEGAYRAT